MTTGAHSFGHLNRQQVGTYAEYFVKMQLTLHGFQVYTSEVDDRGIDFVARYQHLPFIEVQVKASRTANYIFMQKSKFDLHEDLYLALVLLRTGQDPDIYYIPAIRWRQTDEIFVSRDYEGLKSKPEWGLYISEKNILALNHFRIENLMKNTIKTEPNKAVEPTIMAVTDAAAQPPRQP